MGLRGEMLLAFMVGLCLCTVQSVAQLQVGYYQRKCPQAEAIVKDEVKKAVSRNPGLAAGLVRMHFHDCFVRGCDGSILIDSTKNNTSEKDSPPNNPSLRGFEVIDSAKARLESACKGVVSCADTLAFAARDGFQLSGGIAYPVPGGRRDGRVSIASEALSNLPAPSFNLNQLTQSFANKGLTQNEMITLSGGHTIGRSHCSAFSNRLYSFNSTVKQDPSLNPTYVAQLKQQCPQSGNLASLVVPMDPATPTLFDTNYYRDLLRSRGLLTSDQTLMSTPTTAAQVRSNVANSTLFQKNYVAATLKMGKIGVLTGSKGEIRINCRKIN